MIRPYIRDSNRNDFIPRNFKSTLPNLESKLNDAKIKHEV